MSPTELENGEESHPLLDYLFKDLSVLEKILDAWEDHDNNYKPGKHRPGYMGHLTRIANSVIEFTEKGNNSEKIKELCKDISEELQQRWEGFVSGTLAEVNKQNTADLGGSGGLPGLQSSSDSEDPDFSHIPFPQESAMQQVPRKARLFGFNEDEFAEQEERVDAPFTDKISSINFEINADESSNAQTLFEQACNERMQQFDDPDSDEDLWEDKEITFSKSGGGRVSSPNDNTPPRKVGHSSDSEEDEQNSEESTDSEEELDSPRRIYQVPSTTTSTATSTTNTASITSTSGTTVENMDVDSQGWADFSKALATTTTNPDDMETSSAPWEQQQQQQQSEEAQSTSNSSTGENWANFDEIFKKEKDSDADSSQNSENSKTEGGSGEEKWANFTNFEEMESSDSKVVNREQNDLRSVSPIAMDTNESPAPSSSRMAQYLVSSGAADSSQHPTSSSTSDDNVSSPPDTPRPAWDTPRFPPVSSPSVPPADKTISSSSDTSSDVTPSSTAETSQESDKSQDVDECSTEVSSSTQSTNTHTHNHENFLAGSGLMKSPAASDSQASSTSEETSSNNSKMEEPSNKTEDPSSTSETNNELNNSSSETSDNSVTKNEGPSLDSKKIVEEIRAQAQEALEEFSTTTGTSSAQNGPV